MCLIVRIYKAGNLNIFDPFYYLISLIFFYFILSYFGRIDYSKFNSETYFLSQSFINLFIFFILIYTIYSEPLKKIKKSFNRPKINFYYISILLLIVSYFFLSINYLRLFIDNFPEELNFFNRIDRNTMLTSKSFNLPYSNIFFISYILFLLSIKNFSVNAFIKFIPFIPFILFFLIDGDRSFFLKMLIPLFFVLPFIYRDIKQTINIKFIFIIIFIFIFFSLLGNFRSSIQLSIEQSSIDPFLKRAEVISFKQFIPKEFSSVRFTLDSSVSNNFSNKINYSIYPTYGSYLYSFEYIFPRSYYSLLDIKKNESISDLFGNEFAKVIYRDRTLSFGMNGLAEAIYNFGLLGVIFFTILIIFIIDLIKKFIEKCTNYHHFICICLISPILLFMFRNSFSSTINYLYQNFLILGFLYLIISFLNPVKLYFKRLFNFE